MYLFAQNPHFQQFKKLNARAGVFLQGGQPDSIFVLSRQMLSIAQHLRNESLLAESYTNFGDAFMLKNDFKNALLYAVKNKTHRALSIRTGSAGNTVFLSIRDNGAGIPVAIREKVLQPFFATKPAGEGTGLGLSLSHDIVVKGHQGTLVINSREAEFTITLPVGVNE